MGHLPTLPFLGSRLGKKAEEQEDGSLAPQGGKQPRRRVLPDGDDFVKPAMHQEDAKQERGCDMPCKDRHPGMWPGAGAKPAG